jgi:methanogenic corrinoid protein MtbC1
MDPTGESTENDGWAAESGDSRRSNAQGALDPCIPGAADRDEGSRERLAWLVSTIEAEIIPRLMLAHRAPEGARRHAAPRTAPSAVEVQAFARLALSADVHAVRAHVDALRADGVTLDTVYLRLLGPAANYLGTLWSEDSVDFSAVTAALWRMQQLMYDLSPVFQGETDVVISPYRALLAPAPGSQHTFGLLMVAEFFQRAGWDVWTEPAVSLQVLLDSVRTSHFDVVGLSVGSACHLDGVSAALVELRAASLNPQLAIMLGGPLFVGRPELAAQLGADATAEDAREAIAQARRLVERSSLRRALG